jgi:hypothetical protein
MQRLEGGTGAILPRGLFFQKSFEGLSENALGVSRPTVFFPTMTRLFFSILLYLMIFTEKTSFDDH